MTLGRFVGRVGDDDLHAEQRARRIIDAQLTAADWYVQDQAALNLSAGPGVAVREKFMAAGRGRADYLLYLDKRAVGVVEAKPAGTALTGVGWRFTMYAKGLSPATRLRAVTIGDRLPVVFEASGSELYMNNG